MHEGRRTCDDVDSVRVEPFVELENGWIDIRRPFHTQDVKAEERCPNPRSILEGVTVRVTLIEAK